MATEAPVPPPPTTAVDPEEGASCDGPGADSHGAIVIVDTDSDGEVGSSEAAASPARPVVFRDPISALEDGRAGSLPEGVVDVYATGKDAWCDAEFTRGFVGYLWQTDASLDHRPNCEGRRVPQATVTTDMRHCLVDWLVDITQEFKLQRSTLFLSVNILDRSLDLVPVRRERLQLLGCACVLIAAKLEEVYAPSVDDMVDISANTYKRREFVEYEMAVSQALGFRLSAPTACHFLVHFIGVAQANPKQAALAWYLAELCLLDYSLVGTRPGLLAAAILHLVRQATLSASAPDAGSSQAVWTPALRYYTRVAPPALEATARRVWAAHKRAWDSQYVAVPTKYQLAERFHVSEFVLVLPEGALRFTGS